MSLTGALQITTHVSGTSMQETIMGTSLPGNKAVFRRKKVQGPGKIHGNNCAGKKQYSGTKVQGTGNIHRNNCAGKTVFWNKRAGNREHLWEQLRRLKY